jgi:hypothetical protein
MQSRSVRAACLVALIAAVSGCGSSPETSRPSAPPALSASDAQATVRAYVRALNERDTRGFCKLLAPWVQARVGVLAKGIHASGSQASVPDTEVCPFGARFIGTAGEGTELRWESASIVSVSHAHIRGRSASVDLRVRSRLVPYADSRIRARDKVERDRVYLVALDGKWRLAKLSAVADTAVVGMADETPPLEPPDIRGEQAWYRERLEETAAQQRQDEQTASGPYVECSSIGAVRTFEDARDDVEPNRSSPGGRQPPALPEVDLVSVGVARSDTELCVEFETAGSIKPPVGLALMLREPGNDDIGDSLGVETLINEPGQAVVLLSGAGSQPDGGRIPARVGIEGQRVSVVVRREDIPPSDAALVSAFDWEASSVFRGALSRHPGVQFSDDVPDGREPNIPYP